MKQSLIVLFFLMEGKHNHSSLRKLADARPGSLSRNAPARFEGFVLCVMVTFKTEWKWNSIWHLILVCGLCEVLARLLGLIKVAEFLNNIWYVLLACGSSKLFDLASDLGSGRWAKGEGQSDWSERGTRTWFWFFFEGCRYVRYTSTLRT
jgi:hypothetical protein